MDEGYLTDGNSDTSGYWRCKCHFEEEAEWISMFTCLDMC